MFARIADTKAAIIRIGLFGSVFLAICVCLMHSILDCLPALNFYRIFYTCKVYDDDDYNGMYG